MTTFSIGIPTLALRGPLRAALATAGRLGADGVEIDARHELRPSDFSQTALRAFRKTLDDAGLRVAALAFPTRRSLGDPDGLERRLLALREAMALAYKLGAGVVTTHAAASPPAADSADASVFRESLDALAAYGEHVGARLAIASAAPAAEQATLFTAAAEGSLGATLDTGALAAAGESAAEVAAALGERVVYVRAGDAVRELAGGGARATPVELGRGSADVPAVLGALEEHGYRGWVTASHGGSGGAEAGLGDAVAYLRAV